MRAWPRASSPPPSPAPQQAPTSRGSGLPCVSWSSLCSSFWFAPLSLVFFAPTRDCFTVRARARLTHPLAPLHRVRRVGAEGVGVEVVEVVEGHLLLAE